MKAVKSIFDDHFAPVRDIPLSELPRSDNELIKKILNALELQNKKPNFTPAATECLVIDPDGEPMKETWSYPSVVGMLLYLSCNTRPDIAFAVSQVARFTHCPKQSHAKAVKMIGRYLAGTSDKGTVISRPKSFGLQCYSDSDFAGLFKRDPDLIRLGSLPETKQQYFSC